MTLLINKLQALPKEYSLITDAWARDCHYSEYCNWCAKYRVKAIDLDLFNVYYVALAEEYKHETTHKPTPEQLLEKHGICDKCGEFFEHHYSEPLASCSCGTSEWYELTPHMKLRQQLNDAMRECKLSHLSRIQRKLLTAMLAEGIIDNEVVDRMSVNELIDEITEYALK